MPCCLAAVFITVCNCWASSMHPPSTPSQHAHTHTLHTHLIPSSHLPHHAAAASACFTAIAHMLALARVCMQDVANALLPFYAVTLLFFAGFLFRFDDIPPWWKVSPARQGEFSKKRCLSAHCSQCGRCSLNASSSAASQLLFITHYAERPCVHRTVQKAVTQPSGLQLGRYRPSQPSGLQL